LYTVPLTAPLKLTAAVAAPLHTTSSAILFTAGVGFTVMVKVPAAPLQPLADGVTVIVAVTGALPLLVAVKLPISPVPLDARPIV
jgi:hypothetical protein